MNGFNKSGEGMSETVAQSLEFEILLADLSSRFINLPVDQVDAEIEHTQRKVCEFLELDLSAVWQWEDNQPNFLILTHLYRPLGGPPVPDRMEASVEHPWALGEVKAGRNIIMDDTESVPAEAVKDREVWRHYGVKTNLTIPLKSAVGLPYGAVSFNDMQKHRHWSGRLVQRLEMVATVFSNALMRKQLELELYYSNAKLELAAESAAAGIWSLNLQNRIFWTTDKARELFGFDADETISVDRFIEIVHPDDRPNVMKTMEEMEDAEAVCSVEYRIRKDNGAECWMLSRGQRRCQVPGESNCVLMGVTVDVTEQKQANLKLKQALEEVDCLRKQLKGENTYLRDHLRNTEGHGDVLGSSPVVRRMLGLAGRVAPMDATVLITGETGTGKELLARYIHDHSLRKTRSMVCVNCAALPAPLIESELFGREKGAYTGAMTKQVGRFEIANGSTLFLDEIGDLPIEVQSKLLRILENGHFEKLGSTKTQHADVRIIAATNVDLLDKVREGMFREDLYHRLNVFPIESPPLRNRRDDIPELTWNFIREFNNKMGRSVNSIPGDVMEALLAYSWPGNVRELRNLIERAMILVDGKTLTMVPPQPGCFCRESATLEDVERNHIIEVLEQSNWRIGGPGGAAERLGLARTTLNSRMKKLGISRSPVSASHS